MQTEIITVEEVAERIHISRATIFNWMQKGIFTQGKHFFKQGRVLRFIWSDDLITALLCNQQQPELKPDSRPIAKSSQMKHSSPLNWDY